MVADAVGGVLEDARLALRGLLRHPRFSVLVAATLAFGIGPSVTVLGVTDQLLLQPLPGAGNSSVAGYLRLETAGDQYQFGEGLTIHEFDELRERASLLEGLASYVRTSANLTMDGGRPIRVRVNAIYGDFFEVLGVLPSEGRLLSASETSVDSNPLVAVISSALRDRLFGLQGDAVGKQVLMDGHAIEIVGVTPAGFAGPVRGEAFDAWVPLGALVPLAGFTRDGLLSTGTPRHRNLLVLPSPGATSTALESQARQLLGQFALTDSERGEDLAALRPVVLSGLSEAPQDRDRTRRALAMMAWAAGLLLAIACANVANLLLFQNVMRRGDVATVRALGAPIRRIVRQHLVKNLVLAVLGIAGGLVVGWLIAEVFRGQLLFSTAEFGGLEFHLGYLPWLLAVAAATVLLFGVLPSALAGRFDLSAELRMAPTRHSGSLARLRDLLASMQVALTLGLLIGGLLLARTIANLNAVETGIEIERVIGATVAIPSQVGPAERHQLQRDLVAAVAAIPGVEQAALDLYGPHGTLQFSRVGLPGDAEAGRGEGPGTPVWQVSPGWFELFGLTTRMGRAFVNADWRFPSTGGAVLTRSLAQRLFGREDVVGESVYVRSAEPQVRRVLGVVEDYTSLISVTAASVEEALRPSGPTDVIFIPFGETRTSQVTVFAKVASSSGAVRDRLREAVESVVVGVPVPEPYLLSDRVDLIQLEERVLGKLLLILATLGALLSGVGLFAVLFFLVASRRREFGIRAALGADEARILVVVARHAATILAAGIGVGALLAYPASAAIRARLFGVGVLDPVSYGLAIACVGIVALLAFLNPARQAMDTDPAVILRQD